MQAYLQNLSIATYPLACATRLHLLYCLYTAVSIELTSNFIRINGHWYNKAMKEYEEIELLTKIFLLSHS